MFEIPNSVTNCSPRKEGGGGVGGVMKKNRQELTHYSETRLKLELLYITEHSKIVL